MVWWTCHQKGMTIVCRSYVIGHKFINPTDECVILGLLKIDLLTQILGGVEINPLLLTIFN